MENKLTLMVGNRTAKEVDITYIMKSRQNTLDRKWWQFWK